MLLIKKLIKKNRSYRRFKVEEKIKKRTLRDLIELASFSASAANLQPLKYIISNQPEKNNYIFSHLSWAGYLQDWNGPSPEERPSSYIVMLCDKEISKNCDTDAGIAAQSILLGATEKGLGGCIFGAIDRKGIRNDLEIEEKYDILYVIAIGKPAEKVILEAAEDGNIKYYRDDEDVHHVPKRSLNNIILSN